MAGRLCESASGHFIEDGRAYVVASPKTPAPWVNVLANDSYGAVVSQAGGGFSWKDNCQLLRLTRWDPDLVLDRQGRFVYLQDLASPNTVWSTTHQPTLVDADVDEIVHGIGFTTYRRRYSGIESEHTVFVPLEDPCEVWIITLRNLSARARNIRVASYVDWHLGGVGEFHREFQRLFIETQGVGNVQLAWKHPNLVENKREQPAPEAVAFHGVTGIDVEHWLSNKAAFLGHPANPASPGSLQSGTFQQGNGRWEDPIAAAVSDIVLEPGQCVSFCMTLGAGAQAPESLKLAAKYTLEQSESELLKVKDHWEVICSETRVDTDDPDFDVMVNHWLRYQTITGRMVGRCAYYQQGGAFGFRDQLQDSLALLTFAPEKTKRQLMINAGAMYEDGGVRHWWHPGTQIFAESRHSDTCLWLAYGTLAYIDETNDLRALEDQAQLLSRETQLPSGSSSLLDHCLRGVDRCLSLRSHRGLPLILAGDWNDGLSHAGLDGKGESVWVGMFLYDILKRLAALLPELGRTDKAAEYAKAAEELKIAVNEYGWDGKWYVEGTSDDGRPLGGQDNVSGQIYLNPQTWSVITGIAPEARSKQALSAVSERLLRPYGALLLTPAYKKVDPYVGYITRYAPGSRENGGVYSHASTWAVQAYAMAGDQATAAEIFRNMLPSAKSNLDHYAAEPYVMPGNVDGPDSPNEGRAGWTWYTGSAAWLYRIALDWICGVRASREGLVVAPVIVGQNREFRIKRKFRGDIFDIHVEGSGSQVDLSCETCEIKAGNTLVSTGQGRHHNVKVRLS